MTLRKAFYVVAYAVAILLFGCSSIPEKPSFTPSTAYDGKYRGTRIDVSKDAICKETTIVGKIVNGKARFRLTYNGTNLVGWVNKAGELKLYDDNPDWEYQFSGKASKSNIEGAWSVGNAPCRGTWSVQRI